MTPLPPDFLARPFAHRTLHDPRAGRPENSLAGARAAVLAGYGIEVDLQLSTDGVPMVFHDDMLNRLTPDIGPVRDRTATELAAIRLTWGTETIPTLADLLGVVRGRVPLLIELKDQSGTLGPAESGMEQAVCDALAGYTGAVALMSFNPHMVARCAQCAPDIPRGLVSDPFDKDDWPDVPDARRHELARMGDFKSTGSSFVSHNAGDITNPRLAEVVQNGGAILCWTVKSENQERMVREVAHNITFEGYLAQIPPQQAGLP
ncbi:MAG: glycerophosphodiester phosphodiesterase family protein [Pseudomonadota bacterium]